MSNGLRQSGAWSAHVDRNKNIQILTLVLTTSSVTTPGKNLAFAEPHLIQGGDKSGHDKTSAPDAQIPDALTELRSPSLW